MLFWLKQKLCSTRAIILLQELRVEDIIAAPHWQLSKLGTLISSIDRIQKFFKNESNGSKQSVMEFFLMKLFNQITLNIDYYQQNTMKVFKDQMTENERDQRHKSIMKMIHEYSNTPSERNALQKMKRETKMQIELRFHGCKINKLYKFPFQVKIDHNEQDDFLKDQTTMTYDLKSQKTILERNTKSLSRIRVKSLERQQTNEVVGGQKRKDNIVLMNEKALRKHNGKLERRKDIKSAVKLPKVKRIDSQSKIRDKKNILDQLLGKKMATQSSPKQEKIQNYLKESLKNKQRKGGFNFFLGHNDQ